MTESKTVAVIAAMNAEKQTRAQVEVKHLTPPDRAAQAAKTLGICWGIGVACVFIPVLHFFLVPTAVVCGIVLSIRKFGLGFQLLGGEIICPECTTGFPVDRAPFNWPKNRACPKCDKRLILKNV